MTNYEFGDVLYVRFPQTDAPGFKNRPVIAILDIGDADLVAVPITSVQRRGPGDLPVSGLKKAGLVVPSYARIAKVSLIHKRNILRRLGQLTTQDRRNVSGVWRSLYELKP